MRTGWQCFVLLTCVGCIGCGGGVESTRDKAPGRPTAARTPLADPGLPPAGAPPALPPLATPTVIGGTPAAGNDGLRIRVSAIGAPVDVRENEDMTLEVEQGFPLSAKVVSRDGSLELTVKGQ